MSFTHVFIIIKLEIKTHQKSLRGNYFIRVNIFITFQCSYNPAPRAHSHAHVLLVVQINSELCHPNTGLAIP